MLLVKLPIPVPSVVLLLVVVAFGEVFQHTPRTVTEAPPSLVMFPPLLAVVVVIEVIAVVVRVGTTGAAVLVVKLSSFPYAVPALLVA
jgi:hypothetical protein